MSLPGQQEVLLADGRRLVSSVRVVEDGARAVLLLEPHRFRVDATPAADMFRVTVRNLVDDGPLVSRHAGRPATTLASSGIDELDLPLVGAAAMAVEWDERDHYDLRIGTLRDPERGTTTFTVHATVTSSGLPAAGG